MAMEYFCCYHSYKRSCEKLTDQELGRLFRSLMQYSETGETQELTGRESIAFDFIAEDIDRAKEAYETKCRSNAENGKKGGRPQKANGFEEKPKKANGFSENPKKPNKEERKEESKRKGKSKEEKEGENPPTPLLNAGEDLQNAFSTWLKYKEERKEKYQPTGLQALMTEVQNNAAKYGEAAIAALIRHCMGNNWKGIIWDKLKDPNMQGTEVSRKVQEHAMQTTNPFVKFAGGGL